MPSNPTLPDDVKRQASILLRNHMLGMELPDDECDDCIDLIAPLIIEWAQKDQAEKDAQLSESSYRQYWVAQAVAKTIRAQFTPETGKPNGNGYVSNSTPWWAADETTGGE